MLPQIKNKKSSKVALKVTKIYNALNITLNLTESDKEKYVNMIKIHLQ